MQPRQNDRFSGSQHYQPNFNRNIGHQPDPSRFQRYNVLPDQSGFTIPNCNTVFQFDEYGGWFDEYNNYYNANGEPSTPLSENYREDYQDDDYDDVADKLAKEYELEDEEGEDDHLAHYDKLYLNIENKRVLQNYLKDQEVQVQLRNLNFQTNEDAFEKFLVDRKIDWIEFEFEYDNRNRFTGICFITLDKQNAERLIEFNGYKFSGRDIKINILKPESDEENEVHEVGVGADLRAELEKVIGEETKEPELPTGKIANKNVTSTQNQASQNNPSWRNNAPQKNNSYQPSNVSQPTSTIQRNQVQQGNTPIQPVPVSELEKQNVQSQEEEAVPGTWGKPLTKKKTTTKN